MPLFDRYLFADYSGAKSDASALGSIRVYEAGRHDDPVRVLRSGVRSGQPLNFSRDALRQEIRARLDAASEAGHRVILGQDHQYGWPSHLRTLSGLNGLTWREGVRRLAQGDGTLPPLDIPPIYASAFNWAVGQQIFWSPLPHINLKYGISNKAPDFPRDKRFRLTELAPPLKGKARPKPADALGGQGEGIVGGQTICGLKQIAQMLDWDDLAWWPFDGLSITDAAYSGKHVAVEIYPSALRPAEVAQTDDNDALHSCLYARDADQSGTLASLLDLSGVQPPHSSRIQVEGWMIGMDPSRL